MNPNAILHANAKCKRKTHIAKHTVQNGTNESLETGTMRRCLSRMDWIALEEVATSRTKHSEAEQLRTTVALGAVVPKVGPGAETVPFRFVTFVDTCLVFVNLLGG